jgi:hypothetical protein
MKDAIATLNPSLGRRWFGAIALGFFGATLIVIAMLNPTMSWFLKIVVPLTGALFIWQAQWNLRVSNNTLYLTREGLFDSQNRVICSLYNMAEVDRGVLAFRPSNGFLVRLHEPESNAWAPGLYWRLGRRLGIGGASHPAHNKELAQAIEVLIMERSLGPENA